MATYPYAQPIGALNQIVTKLRSSFPETLDSGVLKKLAIAPNNESYIINTLRFLGLIDAQGARTEVGHDVFVNSDPLFGEQFAGMVRAAYKPLFELHADAAWTLDKKQLVSFFRSSDKSSELVGGRQADTFLRIAEITGKRPSSGNSSSSSTNGPVRERQKKPAVVDKKSPAKPAGDPPTTIGSPDQTDVSLAVRIEINLPATSDQAVYDAIFSSIRAKLIDRA